MSQEILQVVTIEGAREGYAPDQVVNKTITVGELIEILQGFDPESPILLRNDDGYTYGAIHRYGSIDERTYNEDGEEF